MAASGRSRRKRSEAARSERMQSVGGVLREAMGSERFRRGLALGRLARSWEDVVGDRLGRETSPSLLENGTLVVSVSTAAWGAQVRFLAPDIRRRANEVLGTEEVGTVRVSVGRREPRGTGNYGG